MIRGIVVEGSDCSGKSTLISHLKAELSRSGWDSFDVSHRQGDQFQRYLGLYANADRVLFDRGHFSEIVYGDMWREGRHFTPWQRKILDDIVYGSFIVIFVHAPAAELQKRYKARAYGQTIAPDELEKVQCRFSSLLSDERVLTYESKNMDALNETVEAVFARLRAEELMEDVVKTTLAPPTDEKIRFVLLEGLNGSGKSTLAKLLKVSLVGWGVKTLDYRPGSPFTRFLHEYANGTDTLFDRGHYSEIVYGNIFRKGNHFSKPEMRILDSLVEKQGLLVFCDPPIDIVKQRILSTKYPKHIHESRLSQVREEFLSAIGAAGIDHISVDTSVESDVDAKVKLLSSRIGGAPYTTMGWDSPLESSTS